ncbi:MAG: glycosyltransferase family 4 protein [Actinomycetota bacterium]|nr:glycosyltransferase family 4 protein [Actinomycetota bacterium]
MTSVHQLLPTISPRDAVGNHTLALQGVLRGLGFESEIFSMFRHPDLMTKTHYVDQLPLDADAVIYQLSIGSPVADRWARHPGKKIANYHNITPISLVGKWDGLLAAEVQLGRDQMARYAKVCDHAICDSDFNKAELDALGYPSTETVPVLFDISNAKADKGTLTRLLRNRRGTQVLFVGRIAPNKAHHDLVAAVRTLRDVHDDEAHLHIVGTDGPPGYRRVVDTIVSHAGMRDHVTFHGSITQEELVAHYQAADVFCCLSDHEGFCVPVIEAMHHGLPVVAYECTAVGETVSGGGLLLREKNSLLVAATLHRVGTDAQLAGRLQEAGRRRAADFNRTVTEIRFRDSLSVLVESR